MKRRGLAAAVIAFALVVAACHAGPLHKKVSVDYQGMPLDKVIDDIGSKVGVTLAVRAKFRAPNAPVVRSEKNLEAGRILGKILRQHHLKLVDVNAARPAIVELDDHDEYKIKREANFEFAEKPTVTRDGDQITISFATKAFCDVTVAVENGNGRIIRHLASGVLGDTAPEPFQWNSKKQVLVWDGKDDEGRYVDDKDSHTIRVSLGLKPRFERTLYWHPKKRVGLFRNGFICPQPEGVYVYQAAGVEMVRLYSHKGEYIRTVYPHPADKVKQAKGLEWKTGYDGHRYPQKQGYWRCTLTTGGVDDDHHWGGCAYSVAVQNGRIAVCSDELGRLGTDGTTGGLTYKGPELFHKFRKMNFNFGPHNSALSPDGKTLYMTGFYANTRPLGGAILIPAVKWSHAVTRMDFESQKEPEVWLGSHTKSGDGEQDLFMPSGVCCDAKGNVYVADFHNDRVQVFSPGKKLLASIKVEGPVRVQIHHKTQEIYVFSWAMANRWVKLKPIKPTLRKFTPLPRPTLKASYPLPLVGWGTKPTWLAEVPVRAALDSWTDPPTIWMIPGTWARGGSMMASSVRLYAEQGKKLKLLNDFHADVAQAGIRVSPAHFQRHRLYTDPRNGTLYVAEGDVGNNMGVTRLIKINPDTGKCSELALPMSAEELAFDTSGFAYLRTSEVVGRFKVGSWREVPWDYGEERRTAFPGGKPGKLIGALAVPGTRPVYWHQAGMDVTPKGDLVVHCYNAKNTREKTHASFPPGQHRILTTMSRAAEPYTPRLYPGRFTHSEVHVWDKHGKAKSKDVIPGLPGGHGTYMDLDGDIYVLAEADRLINGKKKYANLAGTIIKFRPGKGRLLSSAKGCPVPLPPAAQPKSLPALTSGPMGRVWAENAEWMYSGIGIARPSAPCQCWNTRFDLDTFGRSFAPETDRYQVAVVDSNGNLILRIGKYGNIEDGVPLIPQSAIRNPKSIGGDEVGLFYPVYVATHTDRRLYIDDPGNGCIRAVKLGYHVDETVKLVDVPDRAP